MTELPPTRTAALELTHYEDRMATYEADPPPLLSGQQDPTVRVGLPLAMWDALGRPSTIVVTYTIEAQ